MTKEYRLSHPYIVSAFDFRPRDEIDWCLILPLNNRWMGGYDEQVFKT